MLRHAQMGLGMSAQRPSPLQWRLHTQRLHTSLSSRTRHHCINEIAFLLQFALVLQTGVGSDFEQFSNLQIHFAGGKTTARVAKAWEEIPQETQKQAWKTIFPFDEWLCASRIATPFLNHFSETVCPKSKSAKVSLLTALSSV